MAIPMGKVLTKLTIINRADQVLAARGFIPLDQVRSVTLGNVLVDTGATTLCLSSATIAELGLELLKERRCLNGKWHQQSKNFPRCKYLPAWQRRNF